MLRFVFVIAAFIVAVPALAADQIPTEAAQSRDLRAYDNGGIYRTAVETERVKDVERLRKFVWAHWTQRRRGYVTVAFQGIDAGTTAYLFIEPVDGHWRIAWRDFYYSLSGTPLPPRDYEDIVTVERCRGSLIFFDADDHIVRFL